MDEKMIRRRVKNYYWQHNLNCATVTLKNNERGIP